MVTKQGTPRAFPGLIHARGPRQALVAALGAVTLAYLAWRIGCTLPGGEPLQVAYGMAFLGAELLLAWLAVTFFAHLNGGTRREPPPPPPADASVDVLITTWDEDPALVRRTAVAARDMEGAPRVWICDDGRRPEIEAMAGAIGVGYRSRPDNAHFKAGNLNAALQTTGGEFVLVLDADHVPRRALLTRTLGYLADPRVAFVQIPQVHYTLESFQHVLDARRGRLFHENLLFHHALQGGAERYGAAMFIGTGAVFRRDALAAVGGFATGTITEDVHTSMRLHAAGFRGVFVDEALAFLAGPETPLAFARQRLRWARGAMQILRKENPLLKAGLGPWQRLAYHNALAGWLAGPATLVMWTTPAIYLLTGLSPISAPAEVALPVFLARVILDISAYLLLTWPQGRLLPADCFRLMIAPLATLATLALLRPDGLQFKVTPKGRQAGLPLVTVGPVAALAALNLAAITVGCDALDDLYAVDGLAAPILLNLLLIAFCGYFALVTLYALLFAFERQASAAENPLPVDLPAELPGTAGVTARVSRLDHGDAWLRSDAPLEGGAAVAVPVPCPDGPLRLEGAARWSVDTGAGWLVRVELAPLAQTDADRLDTFLFEVALPGFLASLRHGPRVHDAGASEGATTFEGYQALEPALL